MDNETTQTALAIIDKHTLATFYDDPTSLDQILDRIKTDARAQAALLDISTERNRDAIKSLRFKVVRSRTALDAAGKDRKAEWAAKANAIDAYRRKVRAELESLETEIDAPLKEWQDAENARIAANEAAIAAIEATTIGLDALSADEIRDRFHSIQPFEFSLEFQARAKRARDGATAQLREAHQAAKVREWLAEEERQRLAVEAELRRKDGHFGAMGDIRRFAEMPPGSTSSDYRLQLDRLDRLPERDWQEFAEEALEAYREIRTALVSALDDAVAAEASAQAAREKLLAIEAAAIATRLAEEAAARKAEEETKAAQALLDAVAERERQEKERADRIAAKEEERRIAGHISALESVSGMFSDAASPWHASNAIKEIMRILDGMAELKRDWQEFRPRFDTVMAEGRKHVSDRLEVVLRHEEDRDQKIEADRLKWFKEAELVAQREAQAQTDAAVEAERQRVAAQAAAEKEAAAKMALNKERQRLIHAAALADIVKAIDAIGGANGSVDGIAKAVVAAIAKGQVRHVHVDYSGK